MVRKLIERGYAVRVVDTSESFLRQSFSKNVLIVPADLRNLDMAMNALKDSDLCVALAARSAGIAFFNQHSAEMLDDNTRIIANTFEALRRHEIKRVVYISSSCVFDHCSSYVATEEMLSKCSPPRTGYPFSKLVGEFYCRAYQDQFGFSYTIIRPFNVYGPGELPGETWGVSHVIPDLVAKIMAGQHPLEIFGNGQQTRSFTHVEDVAHGIILALESKLALNEDFNLGCPEEMEILELAKILWRLCGRKEAFQVKHVPSYPTDVRRRAVDITKAKTLLSWEPNFRLFDGLKEYVNWYKKQKAQLL